jgi:hypothetical protein
MIWRVLTVIKKLTLIFFATKNMSQSFYGGGLKSKDPNHVAEDHRVYEHGRDQFPVNTVKTPIQNTFASRIRNKPQSGLSNLTVSSNGQTDYQLNGLGFTNTLHLDLIIQNTNTTTAINLLPARLIDRVEYYSTDSNNLLATVYGSEIYVSKINESYDYLNRIALAEGINPATFGGVPLAANATQEYILHVPSFIDSCNGLKLNALNSPLRLRIYWSQYGTDTPANCSIIQADILSVGTLFDSDVESNEASARKESVMKYRFPIGNRVCMQSISNMAANSQYDVLLSSANGYYSHFVIYIEPSPLAYSNLTSFPPVYSLQLLDANGVIVGIEMTDLLLRTHASLQFAGWILNTTSGLPGLYVMPFFEGPASVILGGSSTGGYIFRGVETLRIKTPSTWPATATYTVNILGFNYGTLMASYGNLMSQPSV